MWVGNERARAAMEKRYTLLSFTDESLKWEIHKPGCGQIAGWDSLGANKALVRLDLDDSEEEILEGINAFLEMTMNDVELCACTETPPTSFSQPTRPAAIASQQAARARLLREVEVLIDKLVAKRGQDDVGLGDEWAHLRLEKCTDDYIYDLAVEVRKLREKGEPWWRVAYELDLPGSGASNKQGRKGSAFGRRLWRAAWGRTYVGDGVTVQRESKANREARALANSSKPYFLESATDQDIVTAICGKMIHWVTRLPVPDGLVTSAQEAYVHDEDRLVRVKQGPKGRYVEFYEQVDPAQLLVDPRLSIAKSGPLRAVYVDRITRVGV